MDLSDACWADHRLILAKMNICIRQKQMNRKRKQTKINLSLLNQPEIKQGFQSEFTGNIQDIDINSTHGSWEVLRDSILKTCHSTLGKLERKHEDWFDDNEQEINELMREKLHAFSLWHQDYRNVKKGSIIIK